MAPTAIQDYFYLQLVLNIYIVGNLIKIKRDLSTMSKRGLNVKIIGI